MTTLELDSAKTNELNRGVVSAAAAFFPALDGEEVLDLNGFGQLMQDCAPVAMPATDARVTDVINTALTTCYNALRTGLNGLNDTLNDEFEAL